MLRRNACEVAVGRHWRVYSRGPHGTKLMGGTSAATSIQAQKAGVKLTVKTDPTLADKFIGDRHRLQQILTNLLDNGIRLI